jgi:hypothetical protein
MPDHPDIAPLKEINPMIRLEPDPCEVEPVAVAPAEASNAPQNDAPEEGAPLAPAASIRQTHRPVSHSGVEPEASRFKAASALGRFPSTPFAPLVRRVSKPRPRVTCKAAGPACRPPEPPISGFTAG